MTYVVAYVATLGAMVALDGTWLTIMVGRVYRPTLGDIVAPNVNLAAAIVFYLTYAVGLLIFVVLPAVRSGGVGSALLYGALFGLMTYATYDLTCYATLRNWTLQLTLIDMAWGTVLAAAASSIGYWAAARIAG